MTIISKIWKCEKTFNGNGREVTIHWKAIDGNGALKKNITIPLLEKKYHRTGLVVFVIKTQVDKVNPKSIF